MLNEMIDIIGVPLDLGVQELGLKLGPDAFREAGLLDVARRLGLEVQDRGNVELPARVIANNNCDDNNSDTHQARVIAVYCEAVAQMVRDSICNGRIPVCLGGDHSLAVGSISGAAQQVGRIGCVWIDAHPDANTPHTSPSGNIHGMPVAIILGHGPEVLVNVGTPGAKVGYRNICLLGTHDIDDGEKEFLKQHKVPMFTLCDILEQGLLVVLDRITQSVTEETNGIHVSLDLDVLHEAIAPGVGLPSPCGFDMREAVYICEQIAAKCRIVSIDLVSLNPVRDYHMQTAKRGIELLMALLGRSFSFNYDNYLRNQH